ncbi:MAG: DEAD/DEAH box helicase [Candidatus Cloacimonetes bacterium]|nr:DEAD/DEAH box helicase [Candidatus Cloacimonadota bacterium]
MIEKIRSLWRGAQRPSACQITHRKGATDFVFPNDVEASIRGGTISELLLLQFTYLRQLEEEGLARRVVGGFSLTPQVVANSDSKFRALFNFRSNDSQEFDVSFNSQTNSVDFSIELKPILPEVGAWPHFRIVGAEFQIGSFVGDKFTVRIQSSFIMNPIQFLVLNTIQLHQRLPLEEKSEAQNLLAIHSLQGAVSKGFKADLAHFKSLEIEVPDTIGLSGIIDEAGDLSLVPSFNSNKLEAQKLVKRKGQFNNNKSSGSVRIDSRIVVLTEKTMRAVQEILAINRIPRDKVEQFLKSPAAYIDATQVDLESGFSELVIGACRYQKIPLGELENSGISWFENLRFPQNLQTVLNQIQDIEEFDEAIENVKDAASKDLKHTLIKGIPVGIEQPEMVIQAIEHAKDNLRKKTSVSSASQKLDEKAAIEVKEINQSIPQVELREVLWDKRGLKREPLEHQTQGVNWLTSLMESRAGGALLADDMGLGKTYQALLAIRYFLSKDTKTRADIRPVLVVAPLSLLEPWSNEVGATFEESPFRDVIILQGKGLNEYRVAGVSRETLQNFGEHSILKEGDIRYGLKTGDVLGRLDLPNRLVLCSYQTLRDYQFSLCRVDWGIIVFDEAQNLKDPNALQTKAARGLRADFKLMLTGTPVENSLLDCWSIFHIAVPGLLGTMREFRTNYLRPVLRAKPEEKLTVKVEIGRKIRQVVGNFMLRRMKEDHLKGLPPKTMMSPFQPVDINWNTDPGLGVYMEGKQLNRYNELLQQSRIAAIGKIKGWQLEYLQKIMACSLHVELSSKESQNPWDHSRESFAKIIPVTNILDKICERGEKVLIFLISKDVQRQLAVLLSKRYKQEIRTINGDTKVVHDLELTRMKIIDEFSNKRGFAMMILSPVAAGVGLTITAANHVIHLERHWNPAKEAQATDRCYRIGQCKPVSVWYPVTLHPNQESFDQKLHHLLCNKMQLRDAIVTPEPDVDEMHNFLSTL